MADLNSCNPKAQSQLTDAIGNEGGDANLRHPPLEVTFLDEQTSTPSTLGILTPTSTDDPAGNTSPSASEKAEEVVDQPFGLDSQEKDALLARAAPPVTSASERSHDALLDDNILSLEISKGPVCMNANRAESSSFGAESRSSCNALLSSSDNEQGDDRELDPGEILMVFVDNIYQGLAYRFLGPVHARNISKERRRGTIEAGNATVTVHGAVASLYPYPSEIKETAEELR